MTTVAFEVSLSKTLSAPAAAKQARIQRYADEGWEIDELATMFGLKPSWVKLLVRDKVKRFFCAGCGAPALKKNAPCVRCDSDQVIDDAKEMN